jgi:hypothetical protein
MNKIVEKILKGFDRWVPRITAIIVAIFAMPAGVYNIVCNPHRIGVGLIALAVAAACVYFAVNDFKDGRKEKDN